MVELDLTILSRYGMVAVHCNTEEKASRFVNAMCDQYPNATTGWRDRETKWYWYGAEQCYAPHVFDGFNHGKMQFCRKEYWVQHGYTVIPFDELIVRDFGDVSPPSIPIDMLFEIGV